MKLASRFWLNIFVAASFCTCVASCSDEYGESSGQETAQQGELELNQAAEFWSVVGQLTDDVMPDEDWQSATYVPSIGQPDGANTSVRIVSCDDAESAAERFADLVGLNMGRDITAETIDYTYKSDIVGTLHYRKTGSSSVATVDVDILQMPGLSQIIYKSPEQLGENGSFSGTAYYRFGDVVAKTNSDGQTDYWICVRPCFGPEGKGDSHWITLSKIPAANVKSVPKTVNGVRLNHVLPKSLCANQSHMQNLAELLYAMLLPDEWAANLSSNYQKLKYFSDFNYLRNFKYHNQHFFDNIAKAWPEGFFESLFGLSKEELRQELSQNGLNLIYSSATMSGNNILLPMASFTGPNLKTKTLSKKSSVWTTESCNIYELTKKGYAEFTDVGGGTQKAWLVRYATGATLAKGGAENPVFDKYKRLPNCRDVFVYNQAVDHLDMSNLRNIEPKTAGPQFDDQCHYHLGDVIGYDDNYWVCVENHPFNGTARFVTFDSRINHSSMTFRWDGIGEDVVFSDEMASAEALTAWITNILLDDAVYEHLRMTLATNVLPQIVPQDEEKRRELVHTLFKYDEQFICDITKVSPFMFGVRIDGFMWQDLGEKQVDGETYDSYLQTPVGYLLTDKMRYATYLIGPTEHWVPYLLCIPEGHDYDANFLPYLDNDPSQSTLKPSHFEWKDMGLYQTKSDRLREEINKPFHVVKVAFFWTHETYTSAFNTEVCTVLDFTKSWWDHPDQNIRETARSRPYSWVNSNIVSRELKFIDNGTRKAEYESVSVASEQ